MTGSTPPWRRRFRKSGAESDPVEGVRDDGRGHPASLESADTTEQVTSAREAPVDGPGGKLPPRGAARRAAAVRDGVRSGVRKGGQSARAALGHVADRIIEIAPRIPVRDLATLRKQFPGLGPEQLADKLVSGAAHGASTVGAGVGAAAMMPVPPAIPAELAAEITGVAAIELKLIAELHEVYGRRPEGGLKERSTAYLTSWTQERGIDVARPSTMNNALSGHVKRELRQQIMKRTIRNLPNLTPFMVGAAVGAYMNRRDTRKLADHVREDLRKIQIPWDALPALPPLERPEDPPPLPGGSAGELGR
ncbi:hypothetical protein [Streptomyces tsukubensis]|uniref:Uncharacterized protein n=1 Tax=Streptomyces tsukubensis TaxID=83656 RepID=A0A1V4A4U6_9ACTN|nr:hypothetical protein [Streptomyces tsukubensis]OON75102.1 hypothetical protein B1H18_23330 [Streptomyces tsukubensis]QFR96149.1 hypothetical protein GBW32_27780 [Streptomyces tsukubensis]